jgi:toluene monooxygenase system ferredoxin subunit
MSFRKVATIEDLWSGEMVGLEVDGENILLVNFDDRILAYADTCPHQNSRLSEGILTDRTIRCARHHWEFDLCTGCGINPQNSRLRAYPVIIDGENVLVEINHDKVSGTSADGRSEQ